MNRQIKFRLWNNKNKSWIHAPRKEVNLLGETIILGGLLDGVSIRDLNDILVLQFTGFLDKNNNEIYEGDIIGDHNGISVAKFGFFEVCLGGEKIEVLGFYLKGKNLRASLKAGIINSASVVKYIGTTKGLLTRNVILSKIK